MNIHTRNKISAGVVIIRSRNNYTRGGPGKNSKVFFRKNLTVPKIVAHCRKLSHTAENESFPIFIHCRTHSPCAQSEGSQSESSTTSPESSANQNRAVRHPRALSARVEDPSRL